MSRLSDWVNFLARNHVGRDNAITANDFHRDYAVAYPELVRGTEKSTRGLWYDLRQEALRENTAVGSWNGGYYWPETAEEMAEILKESHSQGLAHFKTEKKLKEIIKNVNQEELL